MTTYYSKLVARVSAPDKVVDDMAKEAKLSDAVEELKERLSDVCRQWVEDNDHQFGPLQVTLVDEA